jgi:hypothetical protein
MEIYNLPTSRNVCSVRVGLEIDAINVGHLLGAPMRTLPDPAVIVSLEKQVAIDAAAAA